MTTEIELARLIGNYEATSARLLQDSAEIKTKLHALELANPAATNAKVSALDERVKDIELNLAKNGWLYGFLSSAILLAIGEFIKRKFLS